MSGPRPQRDTNTEHASRVRDNKRRHRARHKEYVLDLERRLAQTREQGIQATKEVQLAAQRVASENAKLRDLLRKIGYTDVAIDTWVRADGCLDVNEHRKLVSDSMPERSAQKVASTRPPLTGQRVEDLNTSVKGDKSPPMKMFANGEHSPKTSSGSVEPNVGKPELSRAKICAITNTKNPSRSEKTDTASAPCLLLSLLAENPAADITQMSPPIRLEKQPCKNSEPEDCNSNGVECHIAYKMLMHYTTSEEKMETIAAALESGCTPSATGGCRVKNSIMWEVLDQKCI
ncbi:hypothetical protein K432DRAFT_136314 [Lepidopterella palustris CBS 459.81]|uniref:BZIP domain-containing protein n=1 Tax=Lepidopterella palustris CBS 459.81 TaxID=1314670 RepID=A0A8E2E3L5_9PEZI|nr:hypothetical protein K432DRAFT_136314 [Lepidopterella palustris CBS 459.81]